MAIDSKSFTGGDFELLARFLSVNAAQRLPAASLLMPGDLAWRLPGSAPEDDLRLFYDQDGLAAYAWFDPDTDFEFDLRHDLAEDGPVMHELIAWAEDRRRELPAAYPRFIDLQSMDDWAREIENPAPRTDHAAHYLTTVAFESDVARIDRLGASGFERTKHFQPLYRRDLSEPVESTSPDTTGHLRSVTEVDVDARVDVHRAAWLHSSWDRSRYEAIRATSSYSQSLDIVFDTGESFVSYCICWADERTGIGIFEPVGTREGWRGRGVGRAVILEGQRRLRDAGMRFAQVGTAGFNHPAQALYESCGFVRRDTLRTFMKIVD